LEPCVSLRLDYLDMKHWLHFRRKVRELNCAMFARSGAASHHPLLPLLWDLFNELGTPPKVHWTWLHRAQGTPIR